MTNIAKKICALLLALILLLTVAVPSLAWFAAFISANFPTVTGSSEGAFFGDGDGSVDNPYILSAPWHLYNFAWLQYIGYFNLGQANNGRAQSYFRLGDNIDMTGIPLPPIGTTEYPFIGNFDGNGKIISNLTTANAKSLLTERPDNANFAAANELLSLFGGSTAEAGAVIGFFGVVGDYDGELSALDAMTDISLSDATPPTTESDATEQTNANTVYRKAIGIHTFGLADYTLQSSSSATTVGLVAGYVNATVENVLVGHGTVTTLSDAGALTPLSTNISDHALVGHCESAYEETINNTVFSLNDPRVGQATDINNVEGQDANWGGSVAMNGLFQSLAAIRGTNGNGTGVSMSDYAYKATKVMSADGTSYYATDRDTTGAGYMYTNPDTDKSQYSVVYTYGQGNLDEFVWLAGGAKVTTIVCQENTQKQVNGFYIKYGDSYLNIALGGGEPTIVLGIDEASASRWVIENGQLFVLTQGCKLYVNVDSNQELFFHYTAVGNGTWTYDSGTDGTEKGLCYTAADTPYYLKLLDGKWVLREASNTSAYYVIRWDDSDNYLSLTGDTYYGYLSAKNLVGNETTATHWYQTTYQENGITAYLIFTEINGDPYYLTLLNPTEGVWGVVSAYTYWDFEENHLRIHGGDYLVFDDVSKIWTTAATPPSTPVWQAVTVSDDAEEWHKGQNESLSDMTFSPPSPNDDYTFELQVANKNDATYIPLQSGENNLIPTLQNTGYITSGMYNRLFDTNAQLPQANTGDVRFSNFYTQNIYPKDKYPTDTAYNVWANDNGDFTSIGTDSTSAANSGLNKYATSVEAYNALFQGTDRLYGLQFISGQISKESLITIPSATISGLVTNAPLTVPADCIDFSLKQEGYINFFAGTYYPGTNCFFSLHHVVRDANNTILDIKEIKLIYTHTDPAIADTYVYQYTNGEYSVGTTAPAGATIVFDTTWLTNPTNIVAHPDMDLVASGTTPKPSNSVYPEDLRGAAYYFEIPVNAGEYALGSVSGEGKVGATLLYLDIGSSMQESATQRIDRTVVEEMFTELVQADTYAHGVGVLPSVAEGSGYTHTYAPIGDQHMSLTLAVGYGSDLTLLRTDDTVTVSSSANASVTCNAAMGGLTVDPGGNHVIVRPPTGAVATVTKRVTYIDHNIVTGTTTTTTATLTWTDTDADGVLDVGESYTVTIQSDGTTIQGTTDVTAGTTTFSLTHHATQDTIAWADVGTTTSLLAYAYAPAADVTVTNTPTFAVLTGNKIAYTVTIEASAATAVTVTANNAAPTMTATAVTVTAGDNVTLTQAQ